MKRIFPVIFTLITISLIGIIWIQINWVKNIMLVQEEQIKHNVQDISNRVADELGAIKGSQQPAVVKPFPLEKAFDMPHSYAISQRFTAQELYEKIRLQFIAQKMEKVPFEFGIARANNGFWVERRSNNFNAWYPDTANYYRYVRPIVAPSASALESLVPDEMLILIIPRVDELVDVGVRPKIAFAIIFTLIIITAFYVTVSTIFRQKKLSEIKNDFINNMTHEFKTPIATISLAVDALRIEKVQRDQQKLSYYTDIIKEENQRMNRQVETILKAALLERQEIQLNRKELDAHQVIQDVADNFMLRLQEKGGALELKLAAANARIFADEVHFSNLVNNLMDNAVKYGKENVPPKISLSTHSDEKRFFLRIEDNGIGMNRETLKRIFERFYRAHTGNIHNVKGFGLGLSYVKSVIDAHHGNIRAESTLGKGSCFTIELPLHDKEKAS